MPKEYLYHGSQMDLKPNKDLLKPRSCKLVNNEPVVFATNKLWLSIFFIAKASDSDISCGYISEYPCIVEQYPGALDKFLKGVSGFVYCVNASDFKTDSRLGMVRHEFISKKPVKILKKMRIPDIYKALKGTEVNIITFDDNIKMIYKFIKNKNKNK